MCGYLAAPTLDEVLNRTVVLSGLADTFTHTSPGAVRDIVHTLTQHPDKVSTGVFLPCCVCVCVCHESFSLFFVSVLHLHSFPSRFCNLT